MNSDNASLAARAVASVYVTRRLRLYGLIAAAALGLTALFIIYLGHTVNGWWYIFFLPWFVAAFIVMFFMLVAKRVVQLLKPVTNLAQRQAVDVFVEKLDAATEQIELSPYILVWRIVKSVRRGGNYLRDVVGGSTSLRDDFIILCGYFDQ